MCIIRQRVNNLMKCRFCYLILHLNLTSEKHSKTNLYTNIDWYLNSSHNPPINTPGLSRRDGTSYFYLKWSLVPPRFKECCIKNS